MNSAEHREETFQDRFFMRILEHLKRDLNAEGISIRSEGHNLYMTGRIENPITLNFGEYDLLVEKGDALITAADRTVVNGARSLISLTIPSIRGITRKSTNRSEVLSYAASLPLHTWIDSLLGIYTDLTRHTDLLKNYERILNLNQKILLADDLHSVLQIIMDMAKEALNGEGASLLLVDAMTGEMYFNVVSGENRKELHEIRIPAGKGLAGWVVANAHSEIVRDVYEDQRAFHAVDEALNRTTRDMVIAPIPARGRMIGVIEVINSLTSDGFREEEQEFLTNIANHTGLLIENAKGRDELREANQQLDGRNAELNALYEIGRALKTSLEPAPLKKNLLHAVVRELKVERGSILIKSDYGKSLREELSVKLIGSRIEETPIKSLFADVSNLIRWMEENRKPLYFFDTNGEEEESALIRRFRTKNSDLFLSGGFPDAWIPISDRDEELLFVISITGSSMKKRGIAENAPLIGSLMDQARIAFQSVHAYREALNAREKELEIRKTFQKYVPARIVEDILTQAENPAPRLQTVSVLFLDVRNYTGIAETLEPGVLVNLLNEFFEDLVDAVMDNDGVVDKFMGDSMMALFGVPDPSERDADSALLTAMEITRRLARLNQKRIAEKRIPFEVGMAVNTGGAIVGNLGAKRRMDYTAVGDTINIASRLEKAAGIYHTPFLITESTLNALRGDYTVRELDMIQVRGRSSFTRIFEPAISETRADFFRNVKERWETALAEYRKRNFRDAMSLFDEIRRIPGYDPVSELYIIRCLNYLEKPPEKEWEGIFKLDS